MEEAHLSSVNGAPNRTRFASDDAGQMVNSNSNYSNCRFSLARNTRQRQQGQARLDFFLLIPPSKSSLSLKMVETVFGLRRGCSDQSFRSKG